ncbi:MAG: MBL fold metallo-hydrolase [Spirochaetota bacterium]
MRLRLWGVRGSIPVPGPDTVRYGGNTACLELRYGPENKLIIVDAGSGIKPLGDEIVREELKHGPISAKLFLSHTHWDHIIGFPFFVPIFIPGTELDIYSPVNYEERSVEEIIGIQLSYQYFPVRQSELSAEIRYHSLREEVMELDDGMKITAKFLNHPVSTLGYRFDYEGRSIVTLFDHEPFRNVFPTDPEADGYDEAAAHEGEEVARAENDRIRAFYAGADAVIHDTQYTQTEYDEKFTGWGHSTYEWAIKEAHKARVKHLYFFHHDPLRTDDQLDEMIAGYRRKVEGKTSMQIDMAREGLVIEPGAYADAPAAGG